MTTPCPPLPRSGDARMPWMRLWRCINMSIMSLICFSTSLEAADCDGTARIFNPVPNPTTQSASDPNYLTLAGEWAFSADQLDPNSLADAPHDQWRSVEVPGELSMQGFEIEQDREYYYRRALDIPTYAAGQKTHLHFEGAYSLAKVWIDGTLVGCHVGGFTAWDVDITQFVRPGGNHIVTVGVTDRSDDISRASFYAKHNIAGILGDVSLVILPSTYLGHLYVITDLDEDHHNATLTLDIGVEIDSVSGATLDLTLSGPEEATDPITRRRIVLSATEPTRKISLPIASPKLWDAEHPNLYELQARLSVSGQQDLVYSTPVGFREIEVRGEQVLVNGRPVKLRGVNRHHIDPRLGRIDTPDLAAKDIALFKDANINFIRTSHYPPTREFLELADRMGMYVEVEAPVTWWNPTEDSSPYTAEFMDNFTTMIGYHRNHPSVLIWSLGNESFWDPNFDLEFDYAKRVDPTRPLIWSFVNERAREGSRYDIFANHYPKLNDAPNNVEKPVLFEEYAHVYSYDFPILQRDPNARNFWGESVAKFSEQMFANDAILGGAIWGGIDEVFQAPDGIHGYGEWGLIDTWRRRKPEHWLTKKAYSPIRIVDAPLARPTDGETLHIPVTNRYDHTNLSEIEVQWSVGEELHRVSGPDIDPRSSGHIAIPARAWKDGDILSLRFYRNSDLIDAFDLPIGARANSRALASDEQANAKRPEIVETAETIKISGETFSIRFDKRTGQITEGRYDGVVLISGGPTLAVQPALLSEWESGSISTARVGNKARITLDGAFGNILATVVLEIDGMGYIEATYDARNLPDDIAELGIAFDLAEDIDRIAWDRDALWSVFPEDHIGRPHGTAKRRNGDTSNNYRKAPRGNWASDTRNFFLFGADDLGRATHDFRATKTNIRRAMAWNQGSHMGIAVTSDGSQAVRMGTIQPDCMIDDDVPLIIYSGAWEEYEDPGDCGGGEHFSNDPGASASMWFYGDTVKWIGSTHYNMGTADVYIDRKRVASGIDLYSVAKVHQQRLYQSAKLPLGWHEIKVVVTGDKSKPASDSFVVIDGFHASNSEQGDNPTRMHIFDLWGYNPGWGNLPRMPDVADRHSGTVALRPIKRP